MSTRWPSLLTPVASWGLPQTTLRFSSSLEGLAELTESWYTHSYGLSWGKVPSWISQGKECMGQSSGGIPVQCFWLSSPDGILEGITSWPWCMVVCPEYYQPLKLTWVFGVQSCYEAWSRTARVADLSLQPFLEIWLVASVISSSGDENWYPLVQSPHHASHCETVLWPKPPSKQRHSS